MPVGQACPRLLVTVLIIEDQESLDAGTGDQYLAHESRADVRLTECTCKTDGTAENDAGVDGKILQHGIMDRSRGVVEENINAVRTNSGDGRCQVWFGAVIDAGVIAQLSAPGNLLLGARETAMARQPASFAIWPAIWPTEPAAAEMRTVSPGFI